MNFNALRKIFEPNLVWSMALYTSANDFSFSDELKDPIKIFDSRILCMRIEQVHTRADPFMFVWNDELFLFFESMSINQPGCIELYKTTDLKKFKHLGIVLKEAHHLSYPLVFMQGSSVFMIPESVSAGEVALYKFDEFPKVLKKIRTLLIGNYFDSSVIFHEGLWYLFTTSENGLNLFFTKDIENGIFKAHPENPITSDPRICRCGGQPVIVSGSMYRLAQDGSNKYGGNLNILKILELTPTSYREVMAYENYFSCNENWNTEGGHHLSLADFHGQTIIAVDGQQHDYFINKILSPFFSIFAKS